MKDSMMAVGTTVLLFAVNLPSCQSSQTVDLDMLVATDSVALDKTTMKPFNGVVTCEWGENGRLIDGRADGPWREWHDNGQLMMEVNYNNGRQDGLSRRWHEDGKLSMEIHYKDGKMDGISRGWSPDGQLLREEHHKDGELIPR